MEMRPDEAATGPVVQGFSGRGYRVDGQVVAGGVKLTPDEARPWVSPPIEALGEHDLIDLVAVAPEFILLGTGLTLVRPSPSLVAALERRDIGLDPMDSRAAARAWGLLRAEGRHICAALMPL